MNINNVRYKWVVYKPIPFAASETKLLLEEVNFFHSNNYFDTEDEAIQALINEKGLHHPLQDFIIIKKIQIV